MRDGFAPLLSLVLLSYVLMTGVGCAEGRSESDALVVYCAHDSIYSEAVLRDFERETGIEVLIRFDSEATKSLGLVEQIVRERDRDRGRDRGGRRCDVFWNNEQLGMMRLKDEGLLELYQGEGYARIPDGYKDAQGYWTGFAARLRVWIVNTDRVSLEAGEADWGAAIERVMAGEDLSRVAIAKGLYGTTRTHYTVLWDVWGAERTKAWRDDWRARGAVEAASNGQVKNLVASGACDLGLTDTDDYFLAVDAGSPVAMWPVRVEGRVICIPNTVGIIKGTQKPAAARRLVEYLLSEKTQLALARSGSRQIPLGAVDEAALPEDVRALYGWVEEGYPLSELDEARAACLSWLREEYLH